MLLRLSLLLLSSAIAIAPLSLRAKEGGKRTDLFYFECNGKKTQGSGVATGFPINHPIIVRYELNLAKSTLAEIDIDTPALTSGAEPIKVQIYGKNLSTKFHNDRLAKDYEIQIRGDERLFSITVYPANGFEPDTWYGQCEPF